MMKLTSSKVNIKCVNCRCMSKAFSKLSNDQLQKVDLHRSEIHFNKGETICKQGSFMSHMMFVKNGLVKLYMENGKSPMILSLEGEGHFIGLPLLFYDEMPAYHFSVQALTPTDICQVSISLFKEFIIENQKFGSEIIKILSNEVIKGHQQMFSLTQKQIKGRFAELLIHLSHDVYGSGKFKLTLSRKDMADLISSSPESVSRLIKELTIEDIISVDGSDFYIKDLNKLHALNKN